MSSEYRIKLHLSSILLTSLFIAGCDFADENAAPADNSNESSSIATNGSGVNEDINPLSQEDAEPPSVSEASDGSPVENDTETPVQEDAEQPNDSEDTDGTLVENDTGTPVQEDAEPSSDAEDIDGSAVENDTNPPVQENDEPAGEAENTDEPTVEDGSKPLAEEDADPSDDSEDSDATDVVSDTNNSPSPLATPFYGGVLDVTGARSFDISNLPAEYDLDIILETTLSADGSTILLMGENFESDLQTYLLLDAESSETTTLIRDVPSQTRPVFDQNNELALIMAGDCEPPEFDSFIPVPLVLSDLIPEDRCIIHYEEPTLSDDGNVILFYTYEKDFTTQYAFQTIQLHAYTKNIATLENWTDPFITLDEVTVSPRNGAIPFRYTWSLSSDGRMLYSPIWWEGQDQATGNTRQYTSGALWDTTTGNIQTKALTEDLRGCRPTSKVLCTPPYDYVMSTDGNVQYSQVPNEVNDDLLGSGSLHFDSGLVRTETNATTEEQIPLLQSADYVATNNDGSYVFIVGSTKTNPPISNAIYQHSTGELALIDPALRQCLFDSETGEYNTDESACVYRDSPFSIENNGRYFSKSGTTLIMKSISRFTADFETQSVQDFLLDVESGELIELPDGFSGSLSRLSSDTKTLLGRSGFPNNTLFLVDRP